MRQPWIPRATILLLAVATALGNGCSSSTEPTSTTGSLQLTVNGLALAAPAAITVTGPAGYTHTVTVTTTLTGLVPGSYTIAALNVFIANAAYAPAQASQTVNVVAARTAATASVSYAPLRSGWTTKASMSAPRDHLASGVINGILYAVGGDNGSGTVVLATVSYDPSTNTGPPKAG